MSSPLCVKGPVEEPQERFTVEEKFCEEADSGWSDLLICADNYSVLNSTWLRERVLSMGGFKVVYIDPPFDVGTDFSMKVQVESSSSSKLCWNEHAYSDRWGRESKSFLEMIRLRLLALHDLIAEDGWLFLHCDWRTNAHLRLMLDEIFGVSNFQNEIIWSYKSGGATKTRFARKHDTIYLYSKSKKSVFYTLKEKSYNRGLKPYRFKGVEEFEDEIGWYTLVSMRDVWEIDMVGRTSAERVFLSNAKANKASSEGHRVYLSAG